MFSKKLEDVAVVGVRGGFLLVNQRENKKQHRTSRAKIHMGLNLDWRAGKEEGRNERKKNKLRKGGEEGVSKDLLLTGRTKRRKV